MRLIKTCFMVMLLCSVCLAYPPTERATSTGIYREGVKKSFELYNSERSNESIYDRSYENRETLERYGESKWGKEKVPGYVEPEKDKTEYFDQYKSQEKRASKDSNRNLIEEEQEDEDEEDEE